MSYTALRAAFTLVLGLLISSATSRTTTAETCDQPDANAPRIQTISASTFLPGGSIGEVFVRGAQPATVTVFEVDASAAEGWRNARKLDVVAVAPWSEKLRTERLWDNGSVVRFRVPIGGMFWPQRTFLVQLCATPSVPPLAGSQGATSSGGLATDGQGGARPPANGTGSQTLTTIAVLQARVSHPRLSVIISCVVLALFYLAFTYAIYRTRRQPSSVGANWPAYRQSRTYTWPEYLDPVVLTAGPFNTGSIQKLQVLLFTLLVGGMLLSRVLTLGELSDLSVTVALLLGISAVGAAVAQKTSTTKERLKFENWAWLVRRGILPMSPEKTPRWSDLVMTGREFDVYKLQTLIFTAVVAVALLAMGPDNLVTFSIPETLLGILGLSQIVYVGGTLVRPPAAADLDEAITKLRELGGNVKLAISREVEIDDNGKLVQVTDSTTRSPLSPDQREQLAARALARYKKEADDVEIMIESTLEKQIDRKKLELDLAAA